MKIPEIFDIENYNYELPEDLIAKRPVEKRDHSRLLVLNRATGKIEHTFFYEIVDLLPENSILVMNNAKVIPARILTTKKTGGKLEVFFTKKIDDSSFLAMTKGRIGNRSSIVVKTVKYGREILIKKIENKTVAFPELHENETVFDFVKKTGEVPIPPYLKRDTEELDSVRYQTVYAQKEGAVASPTAGLHFTTELLKKIEDKGIKTVFVTLYVGIGTFKPVKVRDIREHKMDGEYFEIEDKVAEELNNAKKEGKKIVGVGTTTVRTLESAYNPKTKKIKPGSGYTEIFIYPGFKFNVINAMITNFHLPKSSLILLVSAFATPDLIKKAYFEAVKKRYRFYSYGDAMFIL